MEDPQTGAKNNVRVEFIDRGGRTEVRLTHDNLPTELSEIVTGGWGAAFDKLGRFLTQPAAVAE